MFSERVIALLAPGQGSQTPGMLAPWLELEGAAERVGAWSEATGLDLVRLGTTAEAEEIQDTSVTQPLVVALALLAYEELRRRVELPADTIIAGHSVGELAAAAIAGVMSTDDAVALAAVRGAEMAAACALTPTGMAAVLLGEQDEVLAHLEQLGLVGANLNGARQIVAAGPLDALEKLVAEPPPGAKVRALKVAGAFHTKFMEPAQEALRTRAAGIVVKDPALPLLSNADGAVVSDGAEVLARLISQVTSPVRWDACQAALAAHGVTALVELPPAGALTGLAKRELKGTPTLALKTPDELDRVVDLLTAADEVTG
ncbi:ACP S-malonyltransferase [Saccharothrix ecbatanensis]|uniref:ACP S-malonyltransferase n=1 Tax=Saccharothrix ecbatanensis TaxID=1105145 RepID=UPI0028AA8B31|nr:ACP S-malonyltransferase [Saccharothrix ecbatanensis]